MLKLICYTFFYAILNVGGATIIKHCLKEVNLNSYLDWLSFILQFKIIFSFIIIIFFRHWFCLKLYH